MEGAGGRDCMKESGVLGGSMLGITLLHALRKASSAAGAAAISVEKGRQNPVDRERRRVVAWRNMLWGEETGDSLGSQVGEKWKWEESGGGSEVCWSLRLLLSGSLFRRIPYFCSLIKHV